MAKANLKRWVNDLRNKNMPVVGSVIAELNSITDDDESNASQLAEVILRDPNLTSHVLRVANSVQYNYSSQKINTISRAIVLIGLKGMRAICISLLILDRLLGDQPRERVLSLVAQGFHAASQAQNLLHSKDANDAEEVFIAGLLFNLGEMSFWMAQELTPENETLLSGNPRERREAMDTILGGSFKSLTRELAQHWKLGDTVQEALFPGKTPSQKAQAVITGERLSRAALFGWDSPQVKKVLGEVAEFRGISLDEALEEVKQSADRAAQVAVSYGAEAACPMIPSSLRPADIARPKPRSRILKPDASTQLSILRELSSAANEVLDVNTIIQMVLEGMHRGVGLERVAIAFIKGHRLEAKYVLGEGTEPWRDGFEFDIGPYTENLFTHVLAGESAHWIDKAFLQAHKALFEGDIQKKLGRDRECLLFVLRINQRNAALFYADRGGYGGQLDEEQFESFKHFATQAQLSLNMLSGRPRPK